MRDALYGLENEPIYITIGRLENPGKMCWN
jgi:hypothetical protein